MDFTLIEARPGITVVLLPDAPAFTVVTVSNDFEKLFGIAREAIVGRPHLDFFPRNPDTPEASGRQQVEASYEEVLRTGKPHALPRQRYDIPNGDGTFSVRYWKALNVPVPDGAGGIRYILHTAEDITELVLSEQKTASLKGMERAYHFFMNAPVIVGLVSGDEYIIELANENLLEVWGRTADVIGKPLTTAIPELEGQGFITLLDSVRRSGESFYAYEYPITLLRHGKEEVLYFDFVYKPFYETDNETVATGVISVGHDVTAQVLAKKMIEENREILRQSNERFHLVSRATQDIVWDWDLLTGEVIWNEALYTHFHYLPEEVEATAAWWAGRMHPDDSEMVLHTIHHVIETGGTSWTCEYRFLCADGSWKTVFDRGFIQHDATGRPIRMIGSMQDVTERKRYESSLKESEQRWQQLANTMPVIVWTAYADGRITFLNENWYRFTGLSPEQSLDFNWAQVIHPDDAERCLTLWNKALEQALFYEIEVRYRRTDGAYRWMLARGIPIKDPEGTVTVWYGTSTDIHDQKMLSENLENLVQERTADLERSNASLEDFAYAASHDLKEPIRKIHFFSDRLKNRLETRMDEEDLRLFERMQQAGKRMAALIDDLLTYSQVSSGALEGEAINLNKKLALVLEDLELEVAEKKARIYSDPLPVIRGNRRQFQQLFQNLISNALKYSRPGVPPHIHILYAKVPGNGGDRNFHQILVRDNGIGFRQEDAERMFQMFTRLHGSPEYRGTGLGLSIVRKVVENHKGQIRAESEPGKGATFVILLPAD